MNKFLLILIIISLFLSPVFAFRGVIWASEMPEIPEQGVDAPQETRTQDFISVIRGVFRIFSWAQNIVKKIISFLTKTYYWITGKMHQPVSY